MLTTTMKNHLVYILDHEQDYILYNKENGNIALIDGSDCTSDSSVISKLTKLEEELEATGFFSNTNRISDIDEIPRNVEFEQLYLITSDGCNLRCKYCRQCAKTKYKLLSNTDIDNALNTFIKHSNKLRSVVFYGGEPLLNKEAIRYALELISKKYPSAKFSIITNAMLCDDETAQLLAKYKVDVIVSADGPAKYHDRARVTINGSPSYEKTIAGYWRMKNAGCSMGISCTIGPHNEKHFSDLVKWITDLHPNSAWFGLPHGSQTNYAMGLTDFPRVYHDVLASFEPLQSEGISLLQVEKKIRDIVENNINIYECKACKNRLVACPGGLYGVCEGAVTDETMFFRTINEAMNISHEFQKSTPFKNNACNTCIAQRICGGGCPYDKILRYGTTAAMDIWGCEFMKHLVHFSLKYVAKFINLDTKCVCVADPPIRSKVLKSLTLYKPGYIPLQFNAEAQNPKTEANV